MADRNALWEQGQDESVEVNQRALIDKVLARYSGEFTVFRELLQNADDAGATGVQITFETKAFLERSKVADNRKSQEGSLSANAGADADVDKPLPALKDIVVDQWTFKNNGTIFREEDWSRLKKIAEGNPDEQKIGAFGVGFYSLFSITEEPFVTSGTKWMGFYWRDGKDQLYARRGTLPDGPPSPWTTFAMPLRQRGPLPGAPLDFLRFLASSITFMTSLKDVELYLDGIRLGHVSKDVGSPQTVGVPKALENSQHQKGSQNNSLIGNAGAMIGGWGDWGMRTPTQSTSKDKEVKWNWPTPKKLFTVNHVTSTSVHIRAEVIRWVYLAGSEKAKPMKKIMPPTSNATKGGSGGGTTSNSFLASLISSFSKPSSSTPRPSPFSNVSGRSTPIPPAKAPSVDKVDVKKLVSDQRKVVESSVLLTVFTAEAKVKLDDKMEVELERATKKRAPPSVKVGLIYTGKDEYDASEKEDVEDANGSKDVGSVFLGLRADLEGNNSSRVYIGHATGQTTGISGHMSARFIPTVERESIDLVDRHVSIWNTELLHVGGYLSRVAYETELAAIARLYVAALQTSSGALSGPDANLVTWLQARCLHALKFFTFRPSTPSAEVSRIMQTTFFSASESFSIYSTAGVKPASEVRVRSPEMEKFVKTLPIVPKEIQDGAPDVIGLLQGRNMIRQITFDDIIGEMRGRCFEEEEMIECLKWRVGLPRQAAFDQHFREQFLGAGVFRVAAKPKNGAADQKGGQDERVIPLATIKTFVNPSGLVPLEGPFPSSTLPLPFSTTKGLSFAAFSELFGWNPFSINDWVIFLSSKPPAESPGAEHDISLSPIFAEKVLSAIAKGWANISKANQDQIVLRLSPLPCIPTQLGLKTASDTYFPAAHVFADLPMVTFPSTNALQGRSKTATESLLAALGVRKHVDLQVVFNRMIKTGDWTIPQLVKYLAGVRDTLTREEIERLKQTAAFSKEEHENPTGKDTQEYSDVKSVASTTTATGTPRKVRYKISSLYEPTDAMRQLKLPVLDWGDNPKWRVNSDEAKFLFFLGLQKYPSLPDLLKLAGGSDAEIRELALRYLFDKFNTQYQNYQPGSFDIAFIPAIGPDGKEFLAKHNQVFSEPGCTIIGFAVVRSDIKEDAQTKLKIFRHPTAQMAARALLQRPPKTEEDARRVFEYLTNILGDFTPSDLSTLRDSPIIPAKTPTSTGITMVRPSECYFKKEDGQANLHSKLFTFIDFGVRANNFLAACGVRNAPTTDEVARMLVANPVGFYQLAGSAERFKAELRQMAASLGDITSATKQAMKRAPILLGSRVADEKSSENRARSNSVGMEEEEDSVTVSYELLRADQIVIIDDVNSYAQFKDTLYGAPQEDILEALYAHLGSPRLSQLIKEEYKPVGEMPDSSDAAKVRKLVLERLPLFLHQRHQGRVLISHEWMQNPSNFVVKKVARLILQKTLVWAGRRSVKDSEASSVAKREGFNRTLILYVAGNIPLDLYEVANSLCKQLFDTPKLNDSLLFSTILSTDLPSLRRRGYNVDRILNQQKVEREARESARRAAEREAAQMRPPGSFVDNTHPEEPASVTGAAPPLPPKRPDDISQTGGETTPRPETPTTVEKDRNSKGFFNTMKNKFSESNRSGPTAGTSTNHRNKIQGNTQPTPESDINKNVEQAINACRPEARNLLQNRQRMEMIKEALDEGYCDVSGMAGDLVAVGTVSNIRIYADKVVPNAQQLLLQTKLDVINRFISIIQPLKKVYKLPDSSLHIFYNLEGPTIAFNAGGALFLNLRYYEGWHDTQLQKKEPIKAMISWFFTLAHEIAHNLIGPHNAEHSYYMNQISSTHLLALVDELQAIQFGIA
ncbi:SubName: Full=Uncharacterized protein {ECO:0000313/EMBL:CCA72144.1} [Serendipita indica DSM 11827]|nr:SubName: Full=Uncharacterized protein {ECO:0000313/EMBL:CCA72144.1} [Serendipita indica DSM 11827]